MSLCIDASAALALHFEDEFQPFEPLEARLAAGEEAYTAPNFFQEVMEALRRAIREGRTTKADMLCSNRINFRTLSATARVASVSKSFTHRV